MLDFHAREFRKQLAAGVPIAVGSDVGPFPHGTQAREFVLMVKYGMTPLAALQAGTLNGAKLLGWQGQIGALKPGYLADVIAVPGNNTPGNEIFPAPRQRRSQETGHTWKKKSTLILKGLRFSLYAFARPAIHKPVMVQHDVDKKDYWRHWKLLWMGVACLRA